MLASVRPIAVCGGAYANPHATRAWVEDARRRGAELLFCLGDLGGFGAECDAVWPVLVDAGVACLAGNYDVAIGRGDEDCGCGSKRSRAAAPTSCYARTPGSPGSGESTAP